MTLDTGRDLELDAALSVCGSVVSSGLPVSGTGGLVSSFSMCSLALPLLDTFWVSAFAVALSSCGEESCDCDCGCGRIADAGAGARVASSLAGSIH